MAFSSSETPSLEWFAGDVKIPSEDQFAIMLAKRTIQLTVEPNMDRLRYKCRAMFGYLVEECGITMDVKCTYIIL